MHGWVAAAWLRLHFDGSLSLAFLPLSEPFLYEANLEFMDVSDTSWFKRVIAKTILKQALAAEHITSRGSAVNSPRRNDALRLRESAHNSRN
jgi:hypothetical protein